MSLLSIEDLINEKQLYVPNILLFGENYNNLSGNALKLYILLHNKSEYGLTNDWVDEHRRVYFIFNDVELSTKLNSSVEVIQNAKKELEDFGLLLQVKKENGENRLYLGTPQATQKDINFYKSNLERK